MNLESEYQKAKYLWQNRGVLIPWTVLGAWCDRMSIDVLKYAHTQIFDDKNTSNLVCHFINSFIQKKWHKQVGKVKPEQLN